MIKFIYNSKIIYIYIFLPYLIKEAYIVDSELIITISFLFEIPKSAKAKCPFFM
jgi:hypothetical protein